MKFAIIAAAAARFSTIVVFGVGIILGAFLAMHPPAATAAYAQSTATTTTATTANGTTGPADFNIAAVGDWGCKSATEDTVDNIMSKSPEVVIGLGDNSYEDSADCWFETVDPIIDKMINVIGNHDVELERPGSPDIPAPELLDEYMDGFGLEEQYYTYRYGNVFVLVMSTETEYKEGSEQYRFVEASLGNASSDSSIDWIIVAMHRQMYGSPTGAVNQWDSGLINAYHPLFQKYGVDLVLSGHNHIYERNYPLAYDGSDDEPIIATNETTNYLNSDGQIFITIGTGGDGLFEFTDRKPYAVSQFDEGFGFLDMEIKNGEEDNGEDDVVQADDNSEEDNGEDDVVQADDNSEEDNGEDDVVQADDNSEEDNNASTLEATFYTNDGSIIDTFTIVKN